MAHSGTWKRLSSVRIPTEEVDEGLGHIVPVATYNKILLTLIILTAITVGAAFLHFGVFNVAIALFIATVKAGLVVAYFMHVKFEKPIILVLVLYPLLILALMIVGTLGDASVRDLVLPVGMSTAASE